MKKLFSTTCLLLILILGGCQKEEAVLQPQVVTSDMLAAIDRSNCIDCLCKAPNGATLPCSELSNWQAYTADYVPGLDPDDPNIAGAPKWKYITKDCPRTANGVPQIKCEKKRNGDCSKAFECTECANCDI